MMMRTRLTFILRLSTVFLTCRMWACVIPI
ncbi:Uncharacterised protein [Vibrio cholerae]|nr:Uncharacterised protein [Vibrio cholerae]